MGKEDTEEWRYIEIACDGMNDAGGKGLNLTCDPNAWNPVRRHNVTGACLYQATAKGQYGEIKIDPEKMPMMELPAAGVYRCAIYPLGVDIAGTHSPPHWASGYSSVHPLNMTFGIRIVAGRPDKMIAIAVPVSYFSQYMQVPVQPSLEMIDVAGNLCIQVDGELIATVDNS
eukprot:gene21549-8271_t